MGFACSHNEIVRFKQNIIRFENSDDIVTAHSNSFVQFVGDNTDHDINTIDGKRTHHGLGSIMVFNGAFGFKPGYRKSIPRQARENWSSVVNNEGIPILRISNSTKSVLRTTKFESIHSNADLEKHPLDLLWVCKKIKAPQCSNWAGFMSTYSKNIVHAKSSVIMLPIIDLSASDPNALFSLLRFVTQQCEQLKVSETAITVDQPLFIKAFDM